MENKMTGKKGERILTGQRSAYNDMGFEILNFKVLSLAYEGRGEL